MSTSAAADRVQPSVESSARQEFGYIVVGAGGLILMRRASASKPGGRPTAVPADTSA